MSNVAAILKPDRVTISRFLNSYTEELRLGAGNVSYPEDDRRVPDDRKIDAIYHSTGIEVHIEHTSIDLIRSGQTNKRKLDQAFLMLQSVLEEISCPPGRGVHVYLRFEYARSVRRLKPFAAPLKAAVEDYLSTASDEVWKIYPRFADVLAVGRREFPISADVLLSSKVALSWIGSDQNFLGPAELESSIRNGIIKKLAKLATSLEAVEQPAYSVLLIETRDLAAESFHSLCGVIARIVAAQQTTASEVWGVRGGSDPTLMWSDFFDLGRIDCVYRDDPYARTYAEIERGRLEQWKELRRSWLVDAESHAAKAR